VIVQLRFGQNDDTKDKVEIVAILSMLEKEIDEALEIVSSWLTGYFVFDRRTVMRRFLCC